MSARALALAWVAVGVVLWNGIFDLHISQGTREYLQIAAEVKAGYGVERSMGDVMGWWTRQGALAASGWMAFIVGAGWTTIWIGRHGGQRAGK